MLGKDCKGSPVEQPLMEMG